MNDKTRILAAWIAALGLATSAQAVGGGPIPGGAGKIGDFVWHDVNENGIQDMDEPGIAGVVVELKTVLNGIVAEARQTTTNSDGLYTFNGLALEDVLLDLAPQGGLTGYEVNVGLPGNFAPGGALHGLAATEAYAGVDPTADSNGTLAFVILPDDEPENLDVDFGFTGDLLPPLVDCDLEVLASCAPLDGSEGGSEPGACSVVAGGSVVFTYEAMNHGATLFDVLVTDAYGPVAGTPIPELATGETAGLMTVETVPADLANTVSFSAVNGAGELCPDAVATVSVEVTPVVEPEPKKKKKKKKNRNKKKNKKKKKKDKKKKAKKCQGDSDSDSGSDSGSQGCGADDDDSDSDSDSGSDSDSD